MIVVDLETVGKIKCPNCNCADLHIENSDNFPYYDQVKCDTCELAGPVGASPEWAWGEFLRLFKREDKSEQHRHNRHTTIGGHDE